VVTVHLTTDVAKADAAIGPWLRRDPVANNQELLLMAAHVGHLADAVAGAVVPASSPPPPTARFWWVTRGDYLSGFALQISPDRRLHVRTDDLSIVPDLVSAVAEEAPCVPGVSGQVQAAASFAAAWATHRHTRVAVAMFQRYYRLDPRRLIPPPPVPGTARPATTQDLDVTILPWAAGFQREVHLQREPATAVDLHALRRDLSARVERGEIVFWDDGDAKAMACAPRPTDGVSRIHLVYTPPDVRGQGLGAAVTAAAVEHALATGASHCTLFTDLANPTSNAVYQRLGFQAVTEALNIDFG
jgi:GNAT superfamily N-acetyltransferase